MAKKKMSAKQKKYFAKKGSKKKTPILGVDYGTGTKMFGPMRKRGRKSKVHFAEGSYSSLSDRGVYVHKGGVKLFKGRKKLKGRKKAKGGHIPLQLLKKRLSRLQAIVKSRS